MGGKRKDEFHQNPFKTLKGFCASKEAGKDKRQARRPVEKDAPAESDDFTLFAREMNQLGLPTPTRGDDPPEAPEAPPKPSGPARPQQPRTEREQFLAALGEMDVTFTDEWPESQVPPPSAEPRRMRLFRQGKLTPEAELDLHGMTRAEARRKALFFLENSVHHGKRVVLVVTGRGLGSGGEPVLRREMETLFGGDALSLVSEWGKAPPRYGGEGALVVFLRGRREKK